MRILVLGVTGMLGHALWLNLRQGHETSGTVRTSFEKLASRCSLFSNTKDSIIDQIEFPSDPTIEESLRVADPSVVVNCVGIVKQLPSARDPITSISINALFPHLLARKCVDKGIRLIHMSTDCAFSGEKGGYVENDVSDAYDLYGRTKFLGEVTGRGCLTIRTSIVGRELCGTKGLFEWFLSQTGEVRGYRKAVFSGLITYALADIIRSLIEEHPAVEGLYHVSSTPISKFDLLNKLKKALDLNIGIVPDDSIVIDRSLDSTRFRKLTHIDIPTWDEMIEGFAERSSNYNQWRYRE